MKTFEEGDRVKWTYLHACGRSSWCRTKHGVFVRQVDHRRTNGWTMYAMVKFDGNKTLSKVRISELKYETLTPKIYRGS